MTTTDLAREEWPSELYVEAWKAFRTLSNENEVTAEHLVRLPSWPKRNDLVICDLGCGDGRLVEQAVLRSISSVAEVRLIDPDEDLLTEAVRVVSETGLVKNVQRSLATAEQVFPECAKTSDAVLLVHVVYLMKNGAFRRLLDACPKETPLFVVMDAPTSVFTELWSVTAPKYHERSLRAHETIAQLLPKNGYLVGETRIASTIEDPRGQRPDLKLALLSMLCYTDARTLFRDSDLMMRVEEILDQHHVAGNTLKIQCESICYEISR
ncbi:MAG: class I SAM-dependent methyltransferase [Acidobacteriota bacterium]